jgi:ABC-type Fe3+-siderophore transport system, permease component
MKLITIIFVTLFPLSFFLSLIYGDVEIPISQLLHPNSIYAYILYEIRLPTILSAIFIGIILSVSGAILQMLLRNPLVDSYISGTASGGAFGAVLTYFLLLFNLPFSWIVFFQPIIAFLMALLATLITIIIGKRSGFLGLIIGGVLVSFVFSSLVTVLLSFMSSKYPQIPPLTFWLLGDISVIGWFDVIILAILSTLLLSLAILKSRIIDLLAISDEISYAHGLNPNNQRILWLALVSFAVAYCVSIAGINRIFRFNSSTYSQKVSRREYKGSVCLFFIGRLCNFNVEQPYISRIIRLLYSPNRYYVSNWLAYNDNGISEEKC